MTWLVILGAVMAVLGLLAVVASALMVARARREETDDAALKARIGRALPVNLAGFGVAILGLMTVVVGMLLG